MRSESKCSCHLPVATTYIATGNNKQQLLDLKVKHGHIVHLCTKVADNHLKQNHVLTTRELSFTRKKETDSESHLEILLFLNS